MHNFTSNNNITLVAKLIEWRRERSRFMESRKEGRRARDLEMGDRSPKVLKGEGGGIRNAGWTRE